MAVVWGWAVVGWGVVGWAGVQGLGGFALALLCHCMRT